MGGTGSILQHERKTCRAEETLLLRLYNRQSREDNKLSGKLRAVGIHNFEMGVGYSPNLGPDPGGAIGLDGKDKSLLRVAQTNAYRDREQWPKRVAGLMKVPELCLRRPSSTANNVAAVAEKKQRRRGGRLRARESVMIQMYNNHHADLDSSLASLRCSFQQCSFQGDGWATASAVSAALKGVGVTVSDSVVLTLANQDGCYAERPPLQPQSAKNMPQKNPTTPAEDDYAGRPLHPAKNILQKVPTNPAEGEEERLVYWPFLLAFLEEGPSDKARNEDDGDVGDDDNDVSDDDDDGDDDDDSAFVVGRKDGLNSTLSAGGMSALQQKTRGTCGGHRREGEDTLLAGGGEDVDQRHVDQRQLGCARGTFVGDGVDGANFDAIRDRPVDVDALVNLACVAGKKGDAPAINDLFDRVDLRRNDAFGRNALYYACLCGHASVAHLVAVRAYGGVEGIPENERWECRKNALSEAIRNYLDTGNFPEPSAPAAEGSGCGVTLIPKGGRGFIESQEGVYCREGVDCQGSLSGVRYTSTPLAPAVGGRGCVISSTPPKGSRGLIESEEGDNCRGVGVDCQGSVSGARHPPPADEAFSIASLFDSPLDQEENGDY